MRFDSPRQQGIEIYAKPEEQKGEITVTEYQTEAAKIPLYRRVFLPVGLLKDARTR